ncbi:acyl carrier protein [Streptomyces sp. XD-27]|uniref:acyl carrier protein n=1 Tax=Streptomyces sp. XD-27 TaxID=3062779 RepID=UPI0026F475A2|nr:acyl carrier protein [Streptomyces sp. XD-27]WKX73261.1 acyl carrier protein [Streptomyces sp. XD-27]
MSTQLSYDYDALAALMKKCAGVTVDPQALRAAPDTLLTDFGLDSLGLLAIVSELEQRHGVAFDATAEGCKTPDDFLSVINETLAIGA